MRGLILLFAGVVVLICAPLIFFVTHWPFTEERVTQELKSGLASDVVIGHFRKIYVPYPGCVAENVIVRRAGPDVRPIATIGKLEIQYSWHAFLSGRRHLDEIRLDRLRIYRPLHASWPGAGKTASDAGSKFTVGEIIANGATLDIAHDEKPEPLHFTFPQLRLRQVGGKEGILYQTVLHNPEPPGIISASGTFGPWDGEAAAIPVSGSFTFADVHLEHYRGLAGLLSAKGQFRGPLGEIDIRGETNVPNFDLDSHHHPVPLRTEFSATVNGLNGDTFLKEVTAHLLNSTTRWSGAIAGKPKVVNLDFANVNARIQDLMRLFVRAPQPPLDGAIEFRAHATLPPEKLAFLKKIRMTANFTITNAHFTNAFTQTKVNNLSAKASGAKDKDKNAAGVNNVTSEIKGHVDLHGGLASFTPLTLIAPGALAQLEGSFNVLSTQIDLRGSLATDSKLSQDAGGIKAILLKPLDPLFKKKDAGAVIPVHIGGNYTQPSYGFSLKPQKGSTARR